MISPIDNNKFKHELKFYDFNMDWYEIPEPIGFDGAKFVMKQGNSWGRDINYFAIDGLTFPKTLGDRLNAPRQINPQGDFCEYLDYGLEWLLANRREKGSEMKVGYRVSVNDVVFREFELDTRDDTFTDGKEWFKCKLIDIGLVADHKRNAKNTFNAFSDKNWKDETITPIESFNYLVKATPLKKTSAFKIPSNTYLEYLGGAATFFNPSQVVTQYEINDTLGWLSSIDSNLSNFGLIKAVVETTDITVNLDVDFDYNLKPGNPLNSPGIIQLFYSTDDNPSGVFLLQIGFGNQGGFPITGTINQTFTFNIDNLSVGSELYVVYRIISRAGIFYRKNTITVTAIEKELDLVIPAVRYIDLIKQSGKFVNNLPIVAPLFDVGGKHHHQAVFNRGSISGKKEMFATPELVLSQLTEVCCDFELSQENIQIKHRSGFYENQEIGSFLVIPSDEYAEPFNEEYLINNYQFGYKNFEQEKTEKGTSSAVHTSSEWLPRNERREDSKNIDLDFIRDPLYKQTVFNLEIKNPSTSTDRDEKLFVEDMTQLAPNTSNVFIRTLLMRWDSNKLEILNRNTLGTNEDAILNWNTLGIGIGTSFEILSGANIGNYTVLSISTDGSILTLSPIGSVSQVTGNYTIKMKYFYSNVQWMTRTNEGFSIAPKDFANLRYTIKRNIFEWYDYLATVVMYAKKDIKNSFFKNFGKLETQLDTETTPVIEDATILYEDLPTPIVEPILIKSTIVAPYNDVVDYLQNYKTTKGFIRIYTPDGDVRRVYPNMFEYSISTAQADIQGEKKYESENLKIDTTNEGIYVDDAFYNMQGIAKWFLIKNNYIQLYDKKSNPLSNFYRYDFVILNGVKYNSIATLVEALNVYTWT